MKASSWLRARPRTLASAGIVTAGAVAISTMAFLYEGFPTTEVDLHDGGVWVTKQSSLLVGHFNHESRVLDSGLRTVSDEYDILQSGDDVLVVDKAGSSVTAVDPAMVVLGDNAQVPGGADVALGGSTLAILDPSAGSLWVLPAKAVASFEVAGNEPAAELGEGADVAVGLDGTVYAVAPATGEVVTIRMGGDGDPAEPERASLDGLGKEADASITVVGDVPIVLDNESRTIWSTQGLRAELAVDGASVLQAPSEPNDAVMVASREALLRVPLDGSEITETKAEGEGTPAEPVFLEGCAYGVWSGSTAFVRDCVGEADDQSTTVPGANPDASLRFRVNRDVIVLNDVIGGAAWMASEDLQKVDNWEDITPPEGETDENDDETTDETVETTLPERSAINTPPVAVDDEFGVRPGRTTMLPVLDNDSDADGDVLTVTIPDQGPSFGEMQSINNGSGLQIAVPEDATGTTTFQYEADDGRGGRARANVQLTVHDWSINGAPKQNRVTAIAVESGGVVSYNVLPDWIDPDGDDVFLRSVTPAEGDEADFTADGRITYRALGPTQGRKDVVISVSDGSEVTEGVVRFDVRPPGSTLPVANADHVVVRAGKSVTVSPLANDTNPSREPLRLTRVDETPGASLSPDYANGRFAFSAKQPGVYYVQYLVSAGSLSAPGVVRVDVLEDAETDLPPIAVRDVALLPSGREVLVDVLANDSDPSGGILVVQSVTVEQSSGVSVSVLGHETLRITDQGALAEQVTVKYTISNGKHSADGEVVVIPIPAPSKLRPPVANDDRVVVRAGDVVTIPVLENDYHPNGDTMHLASELVEPLPEPEDGEIFVAQDTVRFRAGDEPGTVYATYEVVDSTGQKDAGYITIQVLPVTPETNQAPRPEELTARVVGGATVRIAIPLDGIDPDGDSVDLLGIASAPEKGRISQVGPDWLEYQAVGDSVGVDEFTYRVRDRLGAEATASIRVGIAPAGSINQAPYAVKDAIVMRPGRSVAVPVLANDSDPDGDQITLVRNGVETADVPGLSAEVLGDRVVVTSPGSEVVTSLQYRIRDVRGAEAIGVLQITVADDVPLMKPIARDDRILPQDVEDASVDLEVLANDEDPDGVVADLEVTAEGTGVRVLPDGRLRIEIGDEERLVQYRITDRDGLQATAFVRVPSLDSLPPTLATTEGVEVNSGETIEIPLADHVRTSRGTRAVITEAAKVSAVHGDGSELVKDQTTLVYTSEQGYFGQDAITFEVTDGTGPDDPDGLKATLTLPVTVLPPDNQQPEFLNGQISVAPGEEASRLDLRALTTDPDPGDVARASYTLVGGAPSGLSASISDGTLSVSADAATPKGTQATLRVRVTDGETEPIEGDVVVTVTASTRTLPTANDDVIDEANQGTTITVPVTANDFNPFPDRPLKVVAAAVETGNGTAEVRGDQVAVSPSSTFVGTMVVRYRIQDATADVDREVEGRILVTVQGRPEAPGTPSVSSVQDRTVVLSWTPPADNGAPITKYVVSSTRGDYSKDCAATTCTLDGLTNNVEYNFTVVAVNRVGSSDPSPASPPARPDARPDTPQPPTITGFGDRSLSIAWVTPPTPGSPVEYFTLEISPAPPSGIPEKTNITGNTYVWEGLENGTAYQVRVKAHNRAPDASSYSAWSATEIPARAPEPVAAPSTQRLQPVGNQAQLQVSWAAPANNGAPIAGYELQVMRGGSVVSTIPGIPATQTSQAVVVDTSTTDYTFRLRASNKAGWGEWGAQSAPRRAFTPPGAPTITGVTPGDRRLNVTYTPGAGNGATASELRYEYSLNGGGWQAFNGSTITGLTNGTTYQVRLRAYTSMDGVRYDGAPSASSAGKIPYGPVNTPGAGAKASGQSITYSWSAPAPNGRPIQRVQININGNGWENVSLNGNRTINHGYDFKGTIQVRAYDSEGQVSAVRSASDTTAQRPQASAQAGKGSRTNSPTCTSTQCAYLTVTTQNFPAGDYRISCNATGPYGGTPFAGGGTYHLPANGTIQLGCYFGDNGEQVWVTIHGWGDSKRTTW